MQAWEEMQFVSFRALFNERRILVIWQAASARKLARIAEKNQKDDNKKVLLV